MTLKRRKGTQPVVERREHRAEHVMSHASSKVRAWSHLIDPSPAPCTPRRRVTSGVQEQELMNQLEEMMTGTIVLTSPATGCNVCAFPIL